MSTLIKTTLYKAFTQAISFILILVSFMIVFALMTSCNPVRDGYFGEKMLIKGKKTRMIADSLSDEASLDSNKYKNSNFHKLNGKSETKEEPAIWDKLVSRVRFSDTLYVGLPAVRASYIEGFDPKKKFEINDQFRSAIMDFDNGIYDRAMSKFSFFAETLHAKDSLFNEALFYKAECEIQTYKINDAELILLQIYNSDYVKDYTMEKVLIRLGQIYCVKGEDRLAKKYFRELKDAYPNSQYLKLTDCEKFSKQ